MQADKEHVRSSKSFEKAREADCGGLAAEATGGRQLQRHTRNRKRIVTKSANSRCRCNPTSSISFDFHPQNVFNF